MSDRVLKYTILVLALLTLAFQIVFLKEIKKDDLENMLDAYRGGEQYYYDYAPDFTVTCMDGTTFTLSDHLGTNVVVINFFATWCGPCTTEMPELKYFVDQMEGQPVKFIAISIGEQPEVVAPYIDEHELDFLVAVDPEHVVGRKYKIESYPTTIVLNNEGRIMMYEEGAIANADVSLTPIVNQALVMSEYWSDANRETFLKEAPVELPKRIRHSHDEIEWDEDEAEEPEAEEIEEEEESTTELPTDFIEVES